MSETPTVRTLASASIPTTFLAHGTTPRCGYHRSPQVVLVPALRLSVAGDRSPEDRRRPRDTPRVSGGECTPGCRRVCEDGRPRLPRRLQLEVFTTTTELPLPMSPHAPRSVKWLTASSPAEACPRAGHPYDRAMIGHLRRIAMTHGRAVVFGTCVLCSFWPTNCMAPMRGPEGRPLGRTGLPLHTGEVLPRCVCTTPRSARRSRARADPPRHDGTARACSRRPSAGRCSVRGSRWSKPLLCRPPGRHRPRQVDKPSDGLRTSLSSVQLRRHGPGHYRLLTEHSAFVDSASCSATPWEAWKSGSRAEYPPSWTSRCR